VTQSGDPSAELAEAALKAFPDVLSREFGVQPTVTTMRA
jgi:hypothetical protein